MPRHVQAVPPAVHSPSPDPVLPPRARLEAPMVKIPSCALAQSQPLRFPSGNLESWAWLAAAATMSFHVSANAGNVHGQSEGRLTLCLLSPLGARPQTVMGGTSAGPLVAGRPHRALGSSVSLWPRCCCSGRGPPVLHPAADPTPRRVDGHHHGSTLYTGVTPVLQPEWPCA